MLLELTLNCSSSFSRRGLSFSKLLLRYTWPWNLINALMKSDTLHRVFTSSRLHSEQKYPTSVFGIRYSWIQHYILFLWHSRKKECPCKGAFSCWHNKLHFLHSLFTLRSIPDTNHSLFHTRKDVLTGWGGGSRDFCSYYRIWINSGNGGTSGSNLLHLIWPQIHYSLTFPVL